MIFAFSTLEDNIVGFDTRDFSSTNFYFFLTDFWSSVCAVDVEAFKATEELQALGLGFILEPFSFWSCRLFSASSHPHFFLM